ncbi:MAG: hypothetical protein AAFO98_08275, partial [Pseudomonadota bacterium]
MKTALVTLGRLPKGLDICRALSAAGWRVVVAEPSSKHLCGLSCSVSKSIVTPAPNDDAAAYQQALLRIVADEGVSLVVPVSEEIMHASRIVPSLPDGVRWFGLDHDALLPLHDKFRFNRLAASLGLSVPQTDLLGSDAARALVADGDVIVKPALTCSGQGLERLAKGAVLPDAPAEDVLVQRALTGSHSSTFSVAHEGRVIGTVVYRPVVVSDTVAVAFERLTSALQQENWTARFIAQTKHTGFISFDFIDNEDGAPCAIECNPRATSGIHFVTPESLASAVLEPEMCQALAFREPT